MFEEVLKFGAYIVDSLRDYRQPVIVYMPPHSTLRGGAWVVVDPTINEQYMEMYADPSARGGVLETEGTLDVKFRKKDVIATAHRLDEKLRALDQELAALESPDASSTVSAGAASASAASAASPSSISSSSGSPGIRSKESILKDIRTRESLLFPTYHQVATQFADLHDTPGRMRAKNCLDGVIRWENARELFYWKLQKRIKECKWVKRITSVIDEVSPRVSNLAPLSNNSESWREARRLLNGFITTAAGKSPPADLLTNDQTWFQVATQNEAAIESAISSFKNERMISRMREIISGSNQVSQGSSMYEGSQDDTVGAIASIIAALTAEQKAALKKVFT